MSPQIDRIRGLFQRIGEYPPHEVLFEIAVIWGVVYLVIRFVQGTRAAGAIKGLLIVLLAVSLAAWLIGSDAFLRLNYLFQRFLALVAVALVVIFQPELRRGLIRIGETPFLRSTPSNISRLIDAIVPACQYLSKARFGGLIVIERQVGLKGLTEGGTEMGAELSSRLLQTIFFPGSALHDLAVVIRAGRIQAAGVQLPLADPSDMPDASLGSRHRAAVGLTKETDALVVVVSEETGNIRIAERGRLSSPLSPDELAMELKRKLGRTPPSSEESAEGEGDDLSKAV